MNNTPWEATQRDMAAKLTRLTEKVVLQWHLMAESCNICSSLPYRSLGELDTPLYECIRSDWQLLTWGELHLRSGGRTFVLYYSLVLTNLICSLVEMLYWNIHTYVIRRATLEKTISFWVEADEQLQHLEVMRFDLLFVLFSYVSRTTYVLMWWWWWWYVKNESVPKPRANEGHVIGILR